MRRRKTTEWQTHIANNQIEARIPQTQRLIYIGSVAAIVQKHILFNTVQGKVLAAHLLSLLEMNEKEKDNGMADAYREQSNRGSDSSNTETDIYRLRSCHCSKTHSLQYR